MERDETSAARPEPAARPTPAAHSAPRPRSEHAAGPKNKPDARPMRFALGVGGLATLSAIATAIVAPVAAAPAVAVGGGPTNADPTSTPVAVQRPVVYVTLAPGETPPPGAKVIAAAAPKPVTIVTTVAAPAQRPVVVRTTQSGKVIK